MSSRWATEHLHDEYEQLLTLKQAAEQELVAEIDALASSTSERHDDLEKELESSKARILQLQSVDDALEKRAASLENTAARLSQTSRELEASLELLDMSTPEFMKGLRLFFEPFDVQFAVIKSFSFGFTVTAVGCYFGFNTTGGAEGVGRATTRAVVVSSMVILVLDAFWAWSLL